MIEHFQATGLKAKGFEGFDKCKCFHFKQMLIFIHCDFCDLFTHIQKPDTPTYDKKKTNKNLLFPHLSLVNTILELALDSFTANR